MASLRSPDHPAQHDAQENVWQFIRFIRDNWLSNFVFKSYHQIVDLCCDAWNKLSDQPWRIMSLGMHEWARAEPRWAPTTR